MSEMTSGLVERESLANEGKRYFAMICLFIAEFASLFSGWHTDAAIFLCAFFIILSLPTTDRAPIPAPPAKDTIV